MTSGIPEANDKITQYAIDQDQSEKESFPTYPHKNMKIM